MRGSNFSFNAHAAELIAAEVCTSHKHKQILKHITKYFSGGRMHGSCLTIMLQVQPPVQDELVHQ